jgi:hypothetical protein
MRHSQTNKGDAELMVELGARLTSTPGNNWRIWVSDWGPRRVLDRLEQLGYDVVGVAGVGQTCTWTLRKR